MVEFGIGLRFGLELGSDLVLGLEVRVRVRVGLGVRQRSAAFSAASVGE